MAKKIDPEEIKTVLLALEEYVTVGLCSTKKALKKYFS